MREFWANVYPEKSPYFGYRRDSRQEAEEFRRPGAICCIHVRLKPEGAPRRYQDDVERWWWEHEPIIARIRYARA